MQLFGLPLISIYIVVGLALLLLALLITYHALKYKGGAPQFELDKSQTDLEVMLELIPGFNTSRWALLKIKANTTIKPYLIKRIKASIFARCTFSFPDRILGGFTLDEKGESALTLNLPIPILGEPFTSEAQEYLPKISYDYAYDDYLKTIVNSNPCEWRAPPISFYILVKRPWWCPWHALYIEYEQEGKLNREKISTCQFDILPP